MTVFIGNQTTKYAPVDEPFAYARTHGFTAFEWFADYDENADGQRFGWNFDDAGADARTRLRELAIAEKIRFSVHSASISDPRGGAGKVAFRQAQEFAADVGAKLLVIHLCPGDDDIEGFARALTEMASDFPLQKIGVENTIFFGVNKL
jgi:hypothetical protein